MPSGKTHNGISIGFLPVLVGVSLIIGLTLKPILIISLSYLFSSFMFNGDLDIVSGSYNRWGLLRFLWIPYQKMFHHRSIFTHGLIIGTAIRLLYIGIIPTLILYSNGYALSNFLTIDYLYILIGLELGSALHTIADFTLPIH